MEKNKLSNFDKTLMMTLSMVLFKTLMLVLSMVLLWPFLPSILGIYILYKGFIQDDGLLWLYLSIALFVACLTVNIIILNNYLLPLGLVICEIG